MYQKFSILQVSTGLIDKKVEVSFSLQIDPGTVGKDKVILIAKDSGKIPEYELVVSGKSIAIELNEWPEVNTEYLLKIQKGISSIVGDDLPDTLQRNIIFKSEITSLVEVLNPADHEELDSLAVFWRESQVQTSGGLVNSFYMEISENTAFYQPVVKTTVIGRDNITISDIKDGYYYLRVRAQNEGMYGPWSEIVPFHFKKKADTSREDNEYPIVEEDFSLIYSPANGQTPGSFVFEFDKDIDESLLGRITLTRRAV